MIIFIKLLLAHLLGDFLLQPTSWVVDKESRKHRSIYLYLHTLLHIILAFVLVGKSDFLRFAIFLGLTHGFIDFLKLYFQKAKTKRRWFIADQILHFVVLAGITAFYTNWEFDFSVMKNEYWLLITGVFLLTKPTSIIIKNLISVWTPENKTGGENSLQNAGNYIGVLERLFVFCFILTGHFEAIGFLLGAKSIFRFGDLMEAKERKLTEYVLIGTLLSFGIAMLTGLIVNYLLSQML
ncbi:DUF3307 domain-containing protein [Flavobacterium sp. 3HN19-14]|uniref:DUF3307 domain-containing protein n=1 Tax=Flavobacterium sp. 3HN19-14 TaxID=3448133 RepID=UPI003EDF590C